MELVALKAAIGQVRQEYAFSERRACGLMRMALSSYATRVIAQMKRCAPRLVELAREKPRIGYRRLHVLLRRCGEHVKPQAGASSVSGGGLMTRRKKRKHRIREGKPLVVRTSTNQNGRWVFYTMRWSADE